jgi:paraquat-inducible protein B
MEKANYFKLGVFITVGVTTLVALVLLFGGARWFRDTFTMETYFNESVQGLDIGSKVRYRGVVVGDVRTITFTYTRYELDKPPEQRRRYVLVEAAVRPQLMGVTLLDNQRREHEISRGLRVRLAAQGITGQMYLEADYTDPATNPPLPIGWEPENLYIPSSKSTATQLLTAAEALIDRLDKLNIEGTMGNINKLVMALTSQVEQFQAGDLAKRVNRVLEGVDNAHLERLGGEATELVKELRKSNEQLQSTLSNPAWKSLPEDAAAAAKQARQMLETPELQQSITRLSHTVKRLDQLFGGRDADISGSLDNLKQITDNLRDLTENVKRYPGNLLFARPPPPEGATPDQGKK